jgi:hypothetical protein
LVGLPVTRASCELEIWSAAMEMRI